MAGKVDKFTGRFRENDVSKAAVEAVLTGDISSHSHASNDKGPFLTEAALNTAYPVGQFGWKATVGSTDTVWIWDTDTEAWVDSGAGGGGELLLIPLGTSGTQTINRSVSDKFIIDTPTAPIDLTDSGFTNLQKAKLLILNANNNISFNDDWIWLNPAPLQPSVGFNLFELQLVNGEIFIESKITRFNNPVLELDALAVWDAEVIAGSDGDSIPQWNDISGNAYHAIQITSDNQPLLKTGSNGINTKNALLFDGSNDKMLASISGWSVYRDMTIVVVYKSNSTDSPKHILQPQGGAGAWGISNSRISIDNTSYSTTNDTNTNIVIIDWEENATCHVLQNNVSVALGYPNALSYYDWSGIWIGTVYDGSAGFFNGLISYIAVFPRQLDSVDRAAVYNYLAQRYIP